MSVVFDLCELMLWACCGQEKASGLDHMSDIRRKVVICMLIIPVLGVEEHQSETTAPELLKTLVHQQMTHQLPKAGSHLEATVCHGMHQIRI